ncbi:WD40 repeat 2 [Sarocladium implicatum]|nr:WD40 repeat 2 [Sarocladium implicatum]
MESTDPDHFFVSDAAQAQRDRKALKSANKHGNPLSMKSKILAAVIDPASPSNGIFMAESAGPVRRIRLDSPEPVQTYRGPAAPTTCLAVGGSKVYAGSWDKEIWCWDIEAGKLARKFSGHSDFVKTLLHTTLSGKEILISGGADKKILVWDVDTGKRIHTIQSQDSLAPMLALQHLAIDPSLSTKDELVIASASSDPHIRRWKITIAGYEQITESFLDRPDADRPAIEEHQTSVYRLLFDPTDESADLWTASADGSAKCLSRARNFVTEDSFEHTDYVRAVVVTDAWVITAGRDENVKVWDRASGKLQYTLDGHFEEVTDLVLLPAGNGQPERVCSVSIDRTVRTWPLARKELDDLVEKMKAPSKEEELKDAGNGGMTAEEEAELAELMDD